MSTTHSINSRSPDADDLPSTVYAGTDTDLILVLSLDNTNDGSGSVTNIEKVVNAPNPKKLKMGAPNGVATEWVALHPSKPLLYAMTSYWAHDRAIIVTYKVNYGDEGAQQLERLGSTCTQGYQACHAVFSPDGGRYLVVAHYLLGRISIFDTTHNTHASATASASDSGNESGNESEPLGEPILVGTIDLPGTQVSLDVAGKKHKGPLAHGVSFTPDGNHLIACDAGQEQIVVFSFDGSSGCMKEKHIHKCQLQFAARSSNHHGWMNAFITWMFGIRPRHVAIHPSGHFVFVVYETMNVVTWHRFDTEKGTIGMALGQVNCLDPALRHAWFVGVAANLAAEISCDDKYVYVSNRGLHFWGKAENSIVVFEFDDADAASPTLSPSQTTTCRIKQDGMPRHFTHGPNSLIAATQDSGNLYVYRKKRDDDGRQLLELQARSHVGVPMCSLASRDQVQ